MKHVLFPILACAALSACDTPTPLTLDNDDFNLAVVNNNLASALPFTPAEDIPAGVATYEGQFTSSARINDNPDFSLIGDVELRADFGSATPADLSGEISNINVIDRNFERDLNQRLRGTLDIDGVTGGGVLSADAEGELEFVDSNVLGIRQASDVSLRLEGDVRSSSTETPGDFLYGTVDGGGDGGFDLDLTGDGRFTAVAR